MIYDEITGYKELEHVGYDWRGEEILEGDQYYSDDGVLVRPGDVIDYTLDLVKKDKIPLSDMKEYLDEDVLVEALCLEEIENEVN